MGEPGGCWTLGAITFAMYLLENRETMQSQKEGAWARRQRDKGLNPASELLNLLEL